MNKRLIQSILLTSALIVAAGCAQKEKPLIGDPQPTASNAQATTSPDPKVQPSATPAFKQSKVKLYYSDVDQSKLIEKETTISYKQDDDRIGATFEGLKASSDAVHVSLFADVEFATIAFDKEKGELKLDLKFGSKAQLGAPGEDLFVQALKKTAFQFPEVKSLFVLKNGQQVESLMGHVDLAYPIKRTN
jgi:hypothetical protein